MKVALLDVEGPAKDLFAETLARLGVECDILSWSDLVPPFRWSAAVLAGPRAAELDLAALEREVGGVTAEGGRVLWMCGRGRGSASAQIAEERDAHGLLSHPNAVDWARLAAHAVGPVPDAVPQRRCEVLLRRGDQPLLAVSAGWGDEDYHSWTRMRVVHCALPLDELGAQDHPDAPEARRGLENLLWFLLFKIFPVGFGLYEDRPRRQPLYPRALPKAELPLIDLRPILAAPQPRYREPFVFTGTWRIRQDADDPAFARADLSDEDWTIAADPTALEGPKGQVTWGRTRFALPGRWQGLRVHLAASAQTWGASRMWLKGSEIRPQAPDATAAALCGGENVLAIRADRPCLPPLPTLWATAPVWISDLFVRTDDPHDGAATALVTLRNDSEAQVACGLSLQGQCYADAGSEVRGVAGPIVVAPGEAKLLQVPLDISAPRPWSPETPDVYWLRAVLEVDGQETDDCCLNFGLRRFEIRQGDYYLNGRRIFLKGCGMTSARDSLDAQVRDARLIKFLGLNFTGFAGERAAAVCDCAGIMVVAGSAPLDAHASTLFDMATGDFNQNWREQIATPLADERAERVRETFRHSVLELRQHPSLVCWYLAGEVACFHSALWEQMFPRLYETAKENDPDDRPLVLSSWASPYDEGKRDFEIGWRWPESEACRRLHAAHPDVIYSSHLYTGWYNDYMEVVHDVPSAAPDRPFGIRETGACSIGLLSDTGLSEREFLERSRMQLEICKFWAGPWPDLDRLGEATQEYHAEFLRTYLDHFRSLKPQVDDFLNLMLHDAINQKGLIDASGRPKRAFWGMRLLAAPIVIAVRHPGKIVPAGQPAEFALRVVNDEHRALTGRLEWTLRDAAGHARAEGAETVEVPPDSVSQPLTVRWTPPQGPAQFLYLEARLVGADGEVMAQRDHEFLAVPAAT